MPVCYYVLPVSSTDALPTSARLVVQPASVHRVVRTQRRRPHVISPAHRHHVSRCAVQDDSSRRPPHVASALVRLRPGTSDAQLAQQSTALGHLPTFQAQRGVQRHCWRVPGSSEISTQSSTTSHLLCQDSRRLHLPGSSERRGATDLGGRHCYWRWGISPVLTTNHITIALLHLVLTPPSFGNPCPDFFRLHDELILYRQNFSFGTCPYWQYIMPCHLLAILVLHSCFNLTSKLK